MGVSVLIPAYNEQTYLPQTLRCVNDVLNNFDDLEVIIGDHGSTDGTYELSMAAGAVVIDCCDCETVAQVRNRLAEHATNDILIFLDADVMLTGDWMMGWVRYQGYLSEPHAHYILGARPLSDGQSWIARAWFQQLPPASYFGAAHMMVRKDTFFDVGGFNEVMATGEDYDFCSRAVDQGVELVRKPELKAYHARYPSTARAFFLREVWHGTGDWDFVIPKSDLAVLGFSTMMLTVLLLVYPLFAAVLLVSTVLTVTVVKFYPFYEKKYFFHQLLLTYLYLLARGLSMFFQWHKKRMDRWGVYSRG